mgnify:FL=1
MPIISSFSNQFKPIGGNLVVINDLILPPSKEITFNPLLTKNDGVLSTKIAQILNCSYPQALQHIENHTHFWKTSLQHHNYLELNDLGAIRVDENNKCPT